MKYRLLPLSAVVLLALGGTLLIKGDSFSSAPGGAAGTAFGPLFTVGSVSGISGCTHVGFTGATFTTLTSGAISFQTTNNTGAFAIEYCSIAAPATPYKITMQLLQTGNRLGANAFAGGGLAWSNGTAFVTYRFDQSSAPNAITVQMTNATTASGNQTVGAMSTAGVGAPVQGLGQYLQIIDDGTNRTTCYSFDGVKYFQFDQVARTTFLTPTTIGPFIGNSGIIILSWTQTAGTTCG